MSDDVSDKPIDEDLAEDELGDDFDEGGGGEELTDDAGVSGDEGDEGDEDDEDDEDDDARPAVAAGEDDEEEPDPDEVEADLDEILRDRIAANEDDDEEEENVPAPVPTGELVERQDTELHCPHCFLLIQAKTVAETGECGHCGGPIS